MNEMELNQEQIEKVVEQAAEIVAAPKKEVNVKKWIIRTAIAGGVVLTAALVPMIKRKAKARKERQKIAQGGVDNIEIVRQDFEEDDSEEE